MGAVHREVLGLPSFLVPDRGADETVAKAFPSIVIEEQHRQQGRPNSANEDPFSTWFSPRPSWSLIPPYWSFKSSVGRILSLRIFGGTPKDAPLPLDGPALYLQNRSSIRCLSSAVQLGLALQLFAEGINTPPILPEKSSDQADEPHSPVYPTILCNMFSRAAITFFYASVAFGLLAAATPNPVEKRWAVPTTSHAVTTTVTVTAPASTATIPASQCNTSPIQCCNSVQSARSASASAILGLLGIVLNNLDVLVGLTCSPISVIGVGGNRCSAEPVCCENNSVGGAISIGCVPVSL